MTRITRLIIPAARIEHLWRHKISPEQVLSLLTGHYIVTRNRNQRSGTHLLIGTDYLDTCLAVPIIRSSEPGTWLVITAWPCKVSEETKLYGRR